MLKATLSKKGQISIPSALRKRLNLHEGDKLVFEENEGNIILRPLPANPAIALRGRFKNDDNKSGEKKLTKMLIDERRQERKSKKWKESE